MPVDFDIVIDALQRGIAQIPAVGIAVVLLGGPTAALIGYRLIGYRMIELARRRQVLGEVMLAPMWVCQDCRSVNALRLSRCYRCHLERDATLQVEVILDQPSSSPTFFDVPAGSPFAALSAKSARASNPGPGTPVMAETRLPNDSIAVGPGHPPDRTVPAVPGVPAVPVEAGRAASGNGLASALEP